MSDAGSNEPSGNNRAYFDCTWCLVGKAVLSFAIVKTKSEMTKDGCYFNGKAGDQAYELWKYGELKNYLHSCADRDCLLQNNMYVANLQPGCTVEYDKYSKMLAINANHKGEDPNFNEFVPVTTEAEYGVRKRNLVALKEQYLRDVCELVHTGAVHQYPALDKRFPDSKKKRLQRMAQQLSISPTDQFAQSMAAGDECVYIGN